MKQNQLLIFVALCVIPATLASIVGISGTVRGFTFTTSTCGSASCIAIAFTGLTTPLIQGTDYNLTLTGSLPTVVVTVTNLQSGNYTLSDDSGVTWTPSTGVLTNCMNPDIPSISLDTTNSQTFQAFAGGALRLRLRFLENNRYTSINYRYKGSTACNSSVSSTANSTYQVWSRFSSIANCSAPYMQLEQDFNNALTVCNFYRDESDPSNTVFNATVIITTVDTGVVVRGTRYARTLDTVVVIKIAFQTNISASSGSVSVFGPRITASTIASQTWNSNALTATLVLLTSVQWPYQLYTTSFVASVPSDWSVATIVPNPQDSVVSIDGTNIQNRAKCYNPGSLTQAGATAQTYNSVCTQYWTVTLTRNAVCSGSSSITLSGTFTVNFNVTCPNLFNGTCTTPSPINDAVSFSTNSSNYCPQMITNANLNTAVMLTYKDSGYSAAQSQFVFGTTTYFETVVTSPILMSNVAVEYIYVTSGGTSASPYFSRPFSTISTWFGQLPTTGSYGGSGVTGCSSQTYQNGASLAITDNADGNSNAFSKKVRFSILWNSCSSSATGDNPQATSVQVNVRIRFANQTTVSQSVVLKTQILELENSASTNAIVSISQGESAASSSSASTMMIAVVASGIAVVAIIIIAAVVVVVRRTSTNKRQILTVQLSSTASNMEPETA